MRKGAIGLGLCLGLPAFAGTAHANHHFMQIEQAIGGVDGDVTAQAVQLRMRFAGQQFTANGRLRAFDANGANPILLQDMTTSVTNGAAGARVLIASANFASYNTGVTPDYVMTNLIPASYLNGGRITFEDNAGNFIWWSLAFGSYAGSNTGDFSNDANGNFGPPFPSPLPSGNTQALKFQGTAGAMSVSNSTDYALTPGAAVFTNNAGTNATVISDAASINFWDTNGTAVGPGGPGGNNPFGNWDGLTANFNSNPTGGAGTFTAVTSALDTVVFSAGFGGPPAPYTVFVSGTRSAAQVDVEEGFLTLTGGTLAVGTFNVLSIATVGSTLTGGTTGSLTKTGPGALTITSSNTYTGGTNVQNGLLEVNRLHQNNAVNISGGTLRVAQSSPGFPGHPSGDDAFVSRPSSLTIAAGGTLDLSNNDLILDYSGASPIATYEALVASGYNVGVGDWSGTGITSSIAQLDGNYALAIADNAALAAPFGTVNGGPLFAGVDVDLTTILVKFTHRADVDLDGVITPNDSAIFGGNYSENDPAVWTTGDMDYDGIFTPNDAAIFGGFYDESLASLPEPASVCLLGLFALSRRRERSRPNSRPLASGR